MKYLKPLLLLFIFSPAITSAQNKELINSGELIKKCAALYDSSKYKEALPLLEKVNRSDTNYVWSLYEKSIDLEADHQDSAAIKCCQEALSRNEQREYEPDLYNTYGNVLNDLGQYEKAIRVFDLAIAKYPAYSLLYFNKGIVYMAQKRPADAEPWFQKALMINPYMYSAHYQLGLAALQQGKIVPAFLSFIGYLLVNPSGKYFSNSISYLSQISKGTDEILDYKSK
ncbi:MAG: tetratricopeptide repeat protein, partial [Candidatus Saccharimonadales bacterium]